MREEAWQRCLGKEESLQGLIFLYIFWQGLKVTSRQDGASGEDITHEWLLLPLQCLVATEAGWDPGCHRSSGGLRRAAPLRAKPTEPTVTQRHTLRRRCTPTSTSVVSQARWGIFNKIRKKGSHGGLTLPRVWFDSWWLFVDIHVRSRSEGSALGRPLCGAGRPGSPPRVTAVVPGGVDRCTRHVTIHRRTFTITGP